MRALPPIAVEATRLRLPLVDRTALVLETALLAELRSERTALLEGVLAEDASLLLWTLCQSHRRGQTLLPSLHAAADVLANDLLTMLLPLGDVDDEPLASELAQQSATLAGRSIAVALVAERLAEQYAKLESHEAYFLGLLHAAPEWLQLAAEAPHGRSWCAICLPPWHVQLIVDIAEADEPEAEGMAACIRQALAIVDGRCEAASAVADDWRAIDQRRGEIEAAWNREEPYAGWRLIELVRRLARLRELETDFARRLEVEKLEAVRQLAYGAGHEINNPLANISARAQTLIKEEPNPERRRRLAAINAQAFRAHEMIADLMLFARPPDLLREPVDLVQLVDRLIHELAAEAAEQGTQVRRAASVESLVASVDSVQLAVALRAMCVNSLEALDAGGQIEIDVRPATCDDGATAGVEIVVTDTGPGVTPEARRHLFDPFFSGREAGRGLGFGLSKCWRIVTEHGGRIDVSSLEGQGAKFTITLPAAES